MTSWFKRILAQRYPGGEFSHVDWQKKPHYRFDHKGKYQTWGFQPDEEHEYRMGEPAVGELVRDQRLSQIDPKHVEFAIQSMSEKFALMMRDEIIPRIKDFCEDGSNFEDWLYQGCNCVQGNNHWHDKPDPDGDRCMHWNCEGSIQLGEKLNMVNTEVKQVAQQLADRAEIRDPQFVENLAAMMNKQVHVRITKQVQKDVSDGTFFVRVYGKNKAFGGAEEGGWWYDDKQLVDEQQVQGLQNACHMKAQLTKKYENMGEDTFNEDMVNLHGGLRDVYDEQSSAAGGMGDLDYHGDVEGMDIPLGWTPSAFESFFVRVELSDEPSAATQGRPHYE